jgi:recombination protein RecT
MAKAGLIQQTTEKSPQTMKPEAQSINAMINTLLDKEKMRKRFDELLGKRTPQFLSSLVSMLNASPTLQEAFMNAPMTVIQSALKAAAYDLPIDPSLGFAYIVPFNNKQTDGKYRREATFILGYKGMQQLALRTGAYKTLNVIDIREGELKSYNRLTEEIEIEFVEDESAREALKIVGYVGYFKLINGTEKTIYMSIPQIEAHELKHRKGQYRGKGWRDDFEAMCAKTVMRRLIGKWGLMSIDYQQADSKTVAAAEAIASGKFDDEDETPATVEADYYEVDGDTQHPQEAQ